MSVTIHIDIDTPDRELAAIACLIAVLRTTTAIPAPPAISFDYSDAPAADAPAPAPAPAAPPPPAVTAAPPPPASEALLTQEADRVADQAPAATASAPGDLDIEGLPWDARIHSTPATKTAKGVWRARRNLDATVKSTVADELRAAMNDSSVAEPGPTEPAAVDAATAFGAGGAGNAAEAPPAPAAEAPPPPATTAAPPPPAAAAPAETGEITYPQIVTMANDKGMDYNSLNEISITLGLTKFAELAKRPDLFAMFVSGIEAWTAPAATE